MSKHKEQPKREPTPPSSVGSITGPGGIPIEKAIEAWKNPPKHAYHQPTAFPTGDKKGAKK